MHLEDHLGDVIRKARAMSNVSLSAAAMAARLSEQELASLEDTGEYAKKPDFSALGDVLGLTGRKLAEIAAGWLPQVPDLEQWRELRVITTTSGEMAVNAYLVWDEVSREAAIFDTGWEAEPILELVRQNSLVLTHLFITHSHEDHIAALAEIRAAIPKVKIRSGSRNAPVDQRNRANDFVHLGALRITNRPTPGHAEDGTTYVIGNWPEDAPHVAVVGDCLFAGSIGRGNDSWFTARDAVRKQLFSLPDDTLVCPGHGPLTTVGQEKDHNPFF